MAMNDVELGHVVDALQHLVGEPFNGAWQPRRDRVFLAIGKHPLILVPRGPHARIHSVANRPRNPQKPYSFQGALRAHLHGPLTALRRDPDDRIVELVFGDQVLHLRLTGRRGGLWLLDNKTVRAAYDGPAPSELPVLPALSVQPRPARFHPQDGESWDRAASRYFGQAERVDRLRQRRLQLERGLKRELQRLERLLLNLGRDLDKATKAPLLRRQANALAAILHTLDRSKVEVAAQDLEDPNVTWTIALKPGSPPSTVMNHLYAKARRMDRVGDAVLERMDQTERSRDRVRAWIPQIAEADPALLDEVQAWIPKRARRPQDAPPPFWITWTGPQGQQVWVGRNATSNRRLTFNKAKGHHWWMHLRERPGAHLVLPVERGQTPSLDLLLAAGQIALVHGKLRDGSSAEVQYTRVRDVRSIPGAAAGSVRLGNERVLRITRETAALQDWSRDD